MPSHLVIEDIIATINQLPATELRYYLFVIAIECHNKNTQNSFLLLHDLKKLIHEIDAYCKSSSLEQAHHQLGLINVQLAQLEKKTLQHHDLWFIQKHMLNVAACICAFTLGIMAAVFGLVIGFFTQINVAKGAFLGFMSGLSIGCIIGLRLPEKMVLDSWNATMGRMFQHIQTLTSPIKQKTYRMEYAEYENEAKKYVMDTFFDRTHDTTHTEKEEAFNQFLNTEQSFEVCTTQNGFFDRSLKGHFGNHAFIRYKINGIEAPAMEFGARTRYPHWVDQKEAARHVSGHILFNMITLDRQLQKTHPHNLTFTCSSFRVGENDCFTYVDKILLGTGQTTSVVKRFCQQTDTWVGTHIAGRLFRFFNEAGEREKEYFFQNKLMPVVATYTR